MTQELNGLLQQMQPKGAKDSLVVLKVALERLRDDVAGLPPTKEIKAVLGKIDAYLAHTNHEIASVELQLSSV